MFEDVGGIVVGTADVEVAREKMRQLIRETWEGFSADPWQLYDFTHRTPSVERGYTTENVLDPSFCDWVPASGGTSAVIWR